MPRRRGPYYKPPTLEEQLADSDVYLVRRRGFLRRHPVVVGIGIVITLAIAFVFAAATVLQPEIQVPSGTGAQATVAAQVGQDPDDPGISVTATNLHIDPPDDTMPAGEDYAALRVTITNNGSEDLQYNPFDFELQDADDAVTHNWDNTDPMIEGTMLSDGILVPGTKIAGDLTFVVPTHEKTFTLLWQSSLTAPDVQVPIN